MLMGCIHATENNTMKTFNHATYLLSLDRLTTAERVARTVVGVALLSTAYIVSGPMGWGALLPLLAIYPILTGVMGQEPLRFIFTRGSVAYRTAQLAIGGALVGSAFVSSAFAAVPTEVFTLLPLMGVYYVLAGILGQAPLAFMAEPVEYDAVSGTGARASATVVTPATPEMSTSARARVKAA